MGFDEGRIVFDHEDLTYYAGQMVSGKLVFEQTKNKTFRGLFMKMKGECNVHWTTRHSRRVNDRTEHYSVDHNSHEIYYEQKVYLMGGTEGEVHLQPGHYEFPFQLMLPPHCPSSFEGSNGQISYEFKAVVDRSFKFDQEKRVTIRVINQRDLNRDPYCTSPMEFEFEETYCCCCVSSGLCEVNARLPQSGYCPGQTIRFELECANKSNVEIDDIKFELIENRTFRATHEPDTRHENQVIAKLKKGPIAGNTTRKWTLEIDIPQMDLYNVDACNYIDIDHAFKMTVSPSGCHTNTDESRRIVIGHIPLREFEDQPSPDQMVSQPVAPSMSQYPGHQSYPNQPTPGYPDSNPGYPNSNPGYPIPNPGYPNPPYPGGNVPQPNPVPVSPYPNAPYPIDAHPYPKGPGGLPGVSPYPVGSDPFQPGFKPLVPNLPPNSGVPYPINPPMVSSPYVTASAPEPSTPDLLGNNSSPFNPNVSGEMK